MAVPNVLLNAILEKLREQVDSLLNLIELVPPTDLSFRPRAILATAEMIKHQQVQTEYANEREGAYENSPSRLMNLGDLLGHLLECLAGFCALLYKLNPQELSHFQALREKPVNHECAPREAAFRVAEYMSHIEEGFGLLRDQDLVRAIPTVFVPAGESAMTLFLGNLEHLINHKHQLFIYLRLLRANIGTADLYKLRGNQPSGDATGN